MSFNYKKIMNLNHAILDNPFAGGVICGCCGSIFGRKVWNSTDERFGELFGDAIKSRKLRGKRAVRISI